MQTKQTRTIQTPLTRQARDLSLLPFQEPRLASGHLLYNAMGKRKKSSRKPGPTRKKVPLGAYNSFVVAEVLIRDADVTFTCLFCHHDKSVSVRMDRKEGIAQLICKVCDQRFQSKVNRTLPVRLRRIST